uniref:F-box/LRR-repeat protein n=1 Tax=Solanum tuberosum TaxID=4113 RepID=M1B509_SOLTU
MLFASALVSFIPNLKLLSVRCTVLSKPALVIILEGLKKLKVHNISHCIITEDPPPAPMKILTKLDESILEKASRLDKFLTWFMCQHTRNDEGS